MDSKNTLPNLTGDFSSPANNILVSSPFSQNYSHGSVPVPPPTGALLIAENGDFLITESGINLITEG